MGLRIKSGRSTKEKQKGLWEWVRIDKESVTLLIIYLIVILWAINFNT
jgi:hypothetical protein